MKYNILKRLSDFYLFAFLIFLPIVILFAYKLLSDSKLLLIFLRTAFIALYITVLISKKVNTLLAAKFPALTDSNRNLIVTGCLLLVIGGNNVDREETIKYISTISSVIIGIIFVGISKIKIIIGI